MDDAINDAVIACVKACGGSKTVGVTLWPAKGIEAAQRHLLSCLNPDRAEKLGPDEVLHIARLAREKGCHAYMEHLAHSLGYAPPVPTEPRDELTELLRQSNELNREIQRRQERIERLLGPAVRAAA